MSTGYLRVQSITDISKELIMSEKNTETDELLEGLREELVEYGAEDLIIFGLRYTDDDEIDLSIWDSLDDPDLVADLLEDYVKAYRRESKTKK